jgi:filamentous hemagglutinin
MASAGTWGFNAGVQLDIDASKSNTKEQGTTAVASELSGNKIVIQTGTANNIDLITSGDANIRGANVHANQHLEADIQGDLNLESMQNRSNSRNTSMGISGGTSFGGNSDVSGVNGGISSGNGMSVTRETVLTSLTSGGTADVNVKGNTQITGALAS